MAVVVVLVVAALVGCGGNGLPTPPPGGAFIEQVGDQVRVRGQVEFTDGAGNPADPPAGGAVVIIGGESLAAGTDSLGRFLILGFLPWMQGMLVRIGAPGFLPCYATVPAGADSLPEGTLRLVQDTNPNDNPTIENERFAVGLDGIPRLAGGIPNGGGTDLVAFWSQGDDLESFEGAAGAALDTQFFEGPDGTTLFHVTLPEVFSTGRLFASVFNPTSGFSTLAARTCDLRIENWRMSPGGVCQGRVKQGAAALVGASVAVWQESNPGNGGSDQTDGDGDFIAPLSQGTAESVMALVQWTDAQGKVHCCKFRDGQPVG